MARGLKNIKRVMKGGSLDSSINIPIPLIIIGVIGVIGMAMMIKNNKDVHHHDLNFDCPMISPSFVWSPFVKKRKIVINCFSPHPSTLSLSPPHPMGELNFDVEDLLLM